MRLYHYCCSHSARAITDRGFLRPSGKAFFGVDLVWLTDQETPDREGLGLTSKLIPCDRLEHQYVALVDETEVERWLDCDIRREMSRYSGFEAFEEGREPSTWWIARRPVYVERNRRYRAKAS